MIFGKAQPTNVLAKALRDHIDFSVQIVPANKNVRYRLSPLISEKLAQSFNGRKVSS